MWVLAWVHQARVIHLSLLGSLTQTPLSLPSPWKRVVWEHCLAFYSLFCKFFPWPLLTKHLVSFRATLNWESGREKEREGERRREKERERDGNKKTEGERQTTTFKYIQTFVKQITIIHWNCPVDSVRAFVFIFLPGNFLSRSAQRSSRNWRPRRG